MPIKKTLTSLLITVGISYGLLSCAKDQNNPQKLSLTGSSTVAPLASEIAKRFEEEHPGVRIDVQTGGSSRGIADAKQGVADIGMVSRALKSGEKKELRDFAIARDGIGIIINADNPISSLTNEQVIDIYTDKINNWQLVGGKNVPITVVNKAEGRSTLELFLKYFQLENSQIKADVVIGDNQQGIKTVAGNQNAIGYVSIGSAEYDISRNVPIKLLPVDGVNASTETVKNGNFPLSRSLILVTKGQPSGLTLEFIEFAQSAKVNDLIQKQNFVTIKADSVAK